MPICSTPTARPMSASPALIAMIHGAHRGRARGAGVGHVVDGDAGLADLLLQPLADAWRSPRTGCPTARMSMSSIVTPPSSSAASAASAARSIDVLVAVAPELRHRRAEDPDVVGHRWSSSGKRARSRRRWPRCRRRRCRPRTWSSRTGMPSCTWSGSGSHVDAGWPCTTPPPSRSTTRGDVRRRDTGCRPVHDRERLAPCRRPRGASRRTSRRRTWRTRCGGRSSSAPHPLALVGLQVGIAVVDHQVVDERDARAHAISAAAASPTPNPPSASTSTVTGWRQHRPGGDVTHCEPAGNRAT